MRAKIIDKKVMCEEKNIYCGDKNAQVLTFETPCVIDGVNVENMPVYMKCENSLGKKCKTLLTSVKEGDNLIIEWILGEEATLISGKLKCQIVFEDQGGEVVLNFEVFELDIHPSVSENGPKITPEYNQITQLQNQLMALIRDGNLVLPEASAVDEGKILEVNGEGKWVKSEKKLNYLWKKEEGNLFYSADGGDSWTDLGRIDGEKGDQGDSFQITVDEELSETSENPVQNKVVSQAIDEIARAVNTDNYVDISEFVFDLNLSESEIEEAMASRKFMTSVEFFLTPEVFNKLKTVTAKPCKLKFNLFDEFEYCPLINQSYELLNGNLSAINYQFAVDTPSEGFGNYNLSLTLSVPVSGSATQVFANFKLTVEGSSLPTPTSADEGKVLMVNEVGKYYLTNL